MGSSMGSKLHKYQCNLLGRGSLGVTEVVMNFLHGAMVGLDDPGGFFQRYGSKWASIFKWGR